MIRAAEAAGGFGAVLHKGEAQAGTILLVLAERGRNQRLYERMPRPDGVRAWHCARVQAADDTGDFAAYLTRRAAADPDLWIVELDVADAERLIA